MNSPLSSKLKAPIYKLFTVVDLAERIFKCNLCSTTCKARTTSNLITHYEFTDGHEEAFLNYKNLTAIQEAPSKKRKIDLLNLEPSPQKNIVKHISRGLKYDKVIYKKIDLRRSSHFC